MTMEERMSFFMSQFEVAGIDTLEEGMPVEFEIGENRGKKGYKYKEKIVFLNFNKLLEWIGVITAILYSLFVAFNIGLEFLGFIVTFICYPHWYMGLQIKT